MIGGGLARRCLVAGLLALFAMPGHARARAIYPIDQRFASIKFSVSALGLLSLNGAFARFGGVLVLDAQHPEASKVTITIAAKSITMGLSAAVSQLRSRAFFDVARYPIVRFISRRVTLVASGLYRIRGNIEIRGVVRPLVLNARLVRLARRHGRGPRVADFRVTGELRRSSFGMVADRALVSDLVHLRIDAHILLRGAAAG